MADLGDTLKPEKLGALAYVIAGLSFIPLVGIVFGIVAIVWGLVTKKAGGRRLALIGGGGIAFTVAIYSALFYFGFVQRGGIYDDLRAQLAQSTLTSLVPAIEFYKAQHGRYPDSLEVLKQSLPAQSLTSVFDPTDVQFSERGRYFHYELIDPDHYYLLGVGSDGVPFTADDIVPQIVVEPNSSIGLVIRQDDL